MIVSITFIGFIFLVANLSVSKCAGNENDHMALRKIFVGNIPKATPNRALRNYFQKFGEIEEVVVIEGQGYGFVTMKDPKDAEKACSDPNPIIYDRKAKVHLAAKPQDNLPPRHISKNQSPQFQAQHYAPKTSHLSSSATPFVPHTQLNIPAAMPSSLSHLAIPYVPQTLNLARNATPVLPHIQSGIPVAPLPLAYGATHYDPANLATTLQSGIHVIPQHPLAYQYHPAQQYAVPSFHSAIPAVPIPPLTITALGEQIQNNQNQFQEARRSFMSLDGLPSRTKVRISKPSKTESKPKPMIDHAEDSTGHSHPSSSNNEDLFVEPSVNSKDHRDNQQNIRFGTIDYDKFIEKNELHTNSDASNLHQNDELAVSDKSDGTTSVQESSSKAEDKKTSWADLVEEDEEKITLEESNKQSLKEEQESSSSTSLLMNEAGMEGNAGENENSDVKQQQRESKNSGQLRRGAKNRSKNKKKKKGVANAKRNMTEKSELADLGDSPKILEGEGQKKSEKNKSADTGSSSDFMATIDKERADERVKYLYDNLTKFPYRKFLTHKIEVPETNDEYERLINDAVDHLDKDPQKTILEIVKLIKGGLQGRRLKYIRLIGAGSLRQQSAQYIFDKKLRDEHLAALEILKKGVLSGPFFIPGLYFAEIDRKQRQIFAIYKLALAKRLADLFKVPKANVTVEEKHFDDSEKEFLTKEYEYTTILSDDETEENLVKIPSQVAEMGPDEVTLIIILNCSIKMTTDLIKSYGNQSKQLIFMESTMKDLYAKKYTKKEDRKNFQENRRKFQIRKPLPMTFLTDNIFQQKDVNDVQICYAK